MVFKLKTYVEMILMFMLNNSKKFKNFNEFIEFLDFPQNIEILKNRANKIDMAIKMFSI